MSIKRNFIFNSILTVANYIFPFLVFPYVSRRLGPENIGMCNFVDSIINYAMIFSLMGVSVVGVREVAKYRHDKKRLDTAFTSLLSLGAIYTLAVSVVLITATLTLSSLEPYRPLLWIGVLKVWSNFLLIDWLFRGLEDFRYITVRTIAVKTCYVVAVYLLVHVQTDYIIYALLLCLMYTVNAMLNCMRAIKLVKLRFSLTDIKAMVKPYTMMGVYIVLNSMYLTFNTIYLGFTHGDEAVGYYSTSTKIFQIILALYTAYSTVIMPRASSLISQKRFDDLRALIDKSIDALLLIAVPVMFFAMIFSKGIIFTIAGEEFAEATTPMIIIMPLILVIGYEQILVLQFLTPMGRDRVILFNSMLGASVGLIGNLTLVTFYSCIGASVVWVLAEVTVLTGSQIYASRKLALHIPTGKIILNICAYLPYAAIALIFVYLSPFSPIIDMVIGGVFCAVYFSGVQILFIKNPVLPSLLGSVPPLRPLAAYMSRCHTQ